MQSCHISCTTSVCLQVERDNLYSAFYKLTDSSRQITSFVYDCSTPPLCMLAAEPPIADTLEEPWMPLIVMI